MRGGQLLESQRLRCAVSTLNYFPIKVFSFPLNLVCSFRGRNVLTLQQIDNLPTKNSVGNIKNFVGN